MKPSPPARSGPVLRGWTALIPIFIFSGGMFWEKAISELAQEAFSWPTGSPSAVLRITPRVPSPPRSQGACPNVRPAGIYPDHGPLSALLLGAGGLVSHHEEVFVEIVRHLNGVTPVVALVSNDEERVRCEEALTAAGIENRGVHFLEYARDSMWIRDYGPVFVRHDDGSFGIVDASYSGGANTERWRDDECPIVLSQALGLPLTSAPVRLMGGNLLSLGGRAVVTSESVLLENSSRGYSETDVAELLDRHFGVRDWRAVPSPGGEHTRHIDLFVSVLGRETVLVARADPDTDPANAALLDAVAARLAQGEGPHGPLEVHRLPLPPSHDGRFRSYNNLVVVNEVVLVPVFSGVDPELEAEAFAAIRKLCPGKKVVGIPADSMLEVGGLLRCVTLGIPAGVDWRRLFSPK